MKMHLGELLVQSGIITVKTLERALIRQRGTGKKLGAVLDEMGVIYQEELVEALARQFGFQTLGETVRREIPEALLALIPQEVALQKLVFPLSRENGKLSLAIADPFDRDTIEYLEQKTALSIVPVLATRGAILAAVREHYLRGESAENCQLTVLVVDDSPEITDLISAALRSEGYQVLTAGDGVEGLRATFAERPDLILCDSAMPKLDGYGLMRAIKANPASAHIPMILLSAKASPEEEHRALKSGFHDFIGKPMTTVRMVARVKRAFDLVQQLRSRGAATLGRSAQGA
ncbi:two-component system response regulator [Geomonas silvestris]|uniref:Two-component system response regulator n=1 Tax=Geomonas silvestris TaxID=2740184 RepID=A0A6V8MMB3_9BACT|nr:response regulator [Geomonas silvestris]GFO60789.1 two-component system response regulator [Geomonas silvestris]